MRRLAGGVLILVALALAVAGVAIGASWSGFAFVIGLFVLGAGLVATRARGGGRWVTRGGLVILIGAPLLRSCTAGRSGTVAMMGSDGTSSARLLGRIADEGDAAVLATSALTVSGALRDPEAGVLATTMRGAYHRMREAEGDTPSPVLPTYAGLQGPGGFDVVVVDGVEAPLGAVVFLHGFGGSFALPCWEIAQAAREAGLVTYCPSVGWRGDWWTADGEATLRRTVDLVHARRLDRVYLAGLSNGGIGASRLAPRLRGAFKGLILISGAAPDAAPPGVPVLVVQGRRDEMCPAAMGRAYAARVGARYLEVEGGHFALLTHREGVTRAITGWLAQSARSR